MIDHKKVVRSQIVHHLLQNSEISTGKSFMEKYFAADIEGDSHPALDMLKRLCVATKSLSLQVRSVKYLLW